MARAMPVMDPHGIPAPRPSGRVARGGVEVQRGFGMSEKQGNERSAGKGTLQRRARQKLYHRRQIMDTALRLFSEHGFHNVTMHRIAQESEFSIGTLYNFFENKEELYRALVLDLCREMESALSDALSGPGGEDQLIRAYLEAKGRILMNNVPMLRIYFAQTRGASLEIMSALDHDVRAMYERFLRRLAKVFSSGTRKGLFKKMLKPYYMAVALESITNAFLYLWLEDPDRHPYEKNIRDVARLFLENIKAGP